ncbi:MAG: hypothetical protein K0R38_4629, partial [Polyangiaceae bacterium]|nr:hypothetical protein [Polyangiaceae bacterium]
MTDMTSEGEMGTYGRRRSRWGIGLCGLVLLVACGSTRKGPKTEGSGGSSAGESGGGERSEAGNSAVTEAGEASGGAAGSATGQDPTPVSVPPLLPEDDFPTSSVCPGASAVDHWQFPISPQPRAVLAITPSTSYVFYGQLTSTLPSG